MQNIGCARFTEDREKYSSMCAKKSKFNYNPLQLFTYVKPKKKKKKKMNAKRNKIYTIYATF